MLLVRTISTLLSNMKIDVIIGNPPYQDEVEAKGNSAKALYHKFILQSKEYNGKSVFIVPARWFTGGLGLGDFKDLQLNCGNIIEMVYFPKSKDIFETVDIAGGVVILYQDESITRERCIYSVVLEGKLVEKSERKPNEFSIFISNSTVASIVRKIQRRIGKAQTIGQTLKSLPSYRISTSYRGKRETNTYYKVLTSKGVYEIDTVYKENLGYRPYISRIASEHSGHPDKNGRYKVISSVGILDEETICSDSYAPMQKFDTLKEAQNMEKYLKSKFLRAIVQSGLVGIHVNKNSFNFVPMQDFTENSDIDWEKDVDSQLYNKYGLSLEEINHIEKTIKSI